MRMKMPFLMRMPIGRALVKAHRVREARREEIVIPVSYTHLSIQCRGAIESQGAVYRQRRARRRRPDTNLGAIVVEN